MNTNNKFFLVGGALTIYCVFLLSQDLVTTNQLMAVFFSLILLYGVSRLLEKPYAKLLIWIHKQNGVAHKPFQGHFERWAFYVIISVFLVSVVSYFWGFADYKSFIRRHSFTAPFVCEVWRDSGNGDAGTYLVSCPSTVSGDDVQINSLDFSNGGSIIIRSQSRVSDHDPYALYLVDNEGTEWRCDIISQKYKR